jgi:lipopolysaccharide/colanic/teichoic acid biosynthesis glycosyltransferase
VQPSDAENIPKPGAEAAKQPRDGAPAFYKRRRRRDNEIGQILLRRGAITPVQLRQALQTQGEHGGHVGAILRRMGACDSRAIADALIEQVRMARAKGGRDRGLVHAARQNPSIVGLANQCKPHLVTWLLFVADLVALSAASAVMWWFVSNDVLSVTQRVVIASLVPLCLMGMAAVHLYEVTPPSPPEEIRRTTLLVPLLRGCLRMYLPKRPWWGHAVVVIGAGRVGRAVVQTLLRRPQLGLKPVAILDDNPKRLGSVRVAWGQDDMVLEPVSEAFAADMDTPSERSAVEQFAVVEGVPVVGGIDLAAALAQRLQIRSVVIAMPEMDVVGVLNLIERFGDSFTNVVVIPDLFNLAHFGAPTRYLGGVLGIEVQRQLMHRGPRVAKRTMDIALTVLGGLMILPLLVFLALLIKLDSRGSVFYRQRRLGQDGVRFMALKFRTMHDNAEQRLQELLKTNPAMRAEYEMFHKLTDDPRVTRVGRVLRKYSLDELPQIWNVLMGQMSLVGPRPYLEREIPDMAHKEAIVLRVKPGVTGIWQVTTRNESTFEERVNLDVEYVRNWTPWLDLYILARTVPVVVGGTGS